MSENVLEAQDLCKTFPGPTVAVNGLDLRVPRGAVYGLIGRNGAGKTTAIRLLLGLLRPDRGMARILGADFRTAPTPLRARIAYVSQEQQLHGWMTLDELCFYLSHFYDSWDAAYARRLAARFGLSRERPVDLMSGGERRKAAILLALAARPEVLLLDEPAAGLDPISRRELVDELVEILAEGGECTVLFSTHILSDLQRIADRIGIMDRGRLTLSAPLDELHESLKRVQVVFSTERPPEGLRIPGALKTETAGPVVTAIVRISSETQLDEIRALPGVRVNEFPLGLEEIFIHLLGSKDEALLPEGPEP